MIITKTPFRVSFCGGGTDIGYFYRENGGCVLSTTINKYMYVMLHPAFDPKKIVLKYSQNETVEDAAEIRHVIFRCILQGKQLGGVEIVSTADIPSGTGLGSSSAFTVGLLHTICRYLGESVTKKMLAEEACRIEIEKLLSPIGKQDQYAAAYGGMNHIVFHEDESVSVQAVKIDDKTKDALQRNLVMFYTGMTHDANKILKAQQQDYARDRRKKQNLLHLCRLTEDMKTALEASELGEFGSMLHEGWMRKREFTDSVSTPFIDEAYATALRYGALGGKLLGAGGCGFLLFYCPEEKHALLAEKLGLRVFPFSFEQDGSSVVYSS